MDKVKALLAGGIPIPTAIKTALGVSLTEFSARHGLSLIDVSRIVNGSKRPSKRYVRALIAELGGTENEWRELLWLAGKPASSAA